MVRGGGALRPPCTFSYGAPNLLLLSYKAFVTFARYILWTFYGLYLFNKPGFHAVYYIGTMSKFLRVKTWFFGIILWCKKWKIEFIEFFNFNFF